MYCDWQMLRLCENGLTDGVMFDRNGQPTLGGDLLRKRNVLVQRGKSDGI